MQKNKKVVDSGKDSLFSLFNASKGLVNKTKRKLHMKEEKYNGWSNYATWRVNLEMFDGKPEECEEVTAEDCKDYAEMIVDNGSTEGFALDYALAFLQEVNWQEIAEHLNENA